MMNKRNKKMTFRTTEQEYTLIKNKVSESGMNQQNYLLHSALNQKITNTEGVKAVIPELKRIGNNINQIAKHANENNSISAHELEEVRKELDYIWQLLKSQIRTVA